MITAQAVNLLLPAVRRDIQTIVLAYEADLIAAYQAAADLALQVEVERASKTGPLTPEAAAQLVARARASVSERMAILARKRAEFMTNENLEDALIGLSAVARMLGAYSELASHLQQIVEQRGDKP